MNQDMQQVVDEFELQPNRSGFIQCPAHTDATPSLKLNYDYFHCFSCGANGDHYGLIALLTGEDVSQVLRKRGAHYKRRPSIGTLDPIKVKLTVRRQFSALNAAWFKELAHLYRNAPAARYEGILIFWSEVFDDYLHRLNGTGMYTDEPDLSILQQQEIIEELAAQLEKAKPLEEREAYKAGNMTWRGHKHTPLLSTDEAIDVRQRGALP